ncbi:MULTISPECIES: tetratricopeptide repeat protein [unclassified Candidatus Tisiphia]|uniref:tetratricopeptide repeat protein n=1 Tax=unclassified Candidatus Tisiphia TaxID=2996318 RepID=UPI0035C8A4B2
MVNIAISKKAMECSSHLLNTASNNFNQLLEVIVKAIGNATKCSDANSLNAFSENYHLVKDWIPSSIRYNNLLPKHDKDEYFLELDLLSKLQKVLSDKIVSIPNAIMILQQALEIFAEYAESGNVQLQHQIQGYGYCLQQQYEYVKFFASVCGVELPDHAKIAAELITACHAKVIENLEYQVSSLPIDEDKLDQVYYHKAIKYLEDYPDSPACKNLKAIAYSCLASIAEQNGENEALAYYVKAIEANSHLPKIYEKLGQLFFNKGEYAKAIDCYKVINNAVRIKECFKAWLKQDAENPDIMLKQAEYFESVGLFEQAKKYYFNASSISKDDNFKAAAYKKIGNIMANVVAQGQDFITRADEHDFYNYDLVDAAFTSKLLGDSGSECDL